MEKNSVIYWSVAKSIYHIHLNSTLISQGIITQMGPSWNIQLVIPLFYQAGCFWVMEYTACFMVAR